MNKRFGDYNLSDILSKSEPLVISFDHIFDSNLNFSISMIPTEDPDTIPYDLTFDDEIVKTQDQVDKMTIAVNKFFKSSLKSFLKDNSKPITTYPNIGESYIDRPVFYHYQYDIYGMNTGGLTVAVMYNPHDKVYLFGFSSCSKKDIYVKKIGNEIAWIDLNENQFTVTEKNIAISYFNASTIRSTNIFDFTSISINEPIGFIRGVGKNKLMSMLRKIVLMEDAQVLPNSVLRTIREY